MSIFELLTVAFLILLASAVLMSRYGLVPSPYQDTHTTQTEKSQETLENPATLESEINSVNAGNEVVQPDGISVGI